MIWRAYTYQTPTNFMFHSISIKKGDKFYLTSESDKNVHWYVVYDRGEDKSPVKFEVSSYTWYKLAQRSTYT